MLLEELAKDMVDVTSSLVGGRTINIMNTDGIIVASTERERIGTFHQGAQEAAKTGKLVRIHKDQLNRYAGAKEGCNMPLRVNGSIIGVVGIYGNPEEIQDVACLLEVYAAKYYQLEAMLHPRLSINALREQLLTSLLTPGHPDLSPVQELMQTLNIHFRYPVHTIVFSAPRDLSLPDQSRRLCSYLEELGFQNKQTDVWGIADCRLVLICSHREEQHLKRLDTLTSRGYRINLGLPSQNLWEIQEAYHQAVVLDSSSNAAVNDISQVDTRCRYLISNTALQQAAFLDELLQGLRNVFQEEELRILLESVQAYYDCSKSVTEAAKKLFIHKNTLQYRIKRVLQVLEISRLPAFRQEYLIRLLIDHYYRKSRS